MTGETPVERPLGAARAGASLTGPQVAEFAGVQRTPGPKIGIETDPGGGRGSGQGRKEGAGHTLDARLRAGVARVRGVEEEQGRNYGRGVVAARVVNRLKARLSTRTSPERPSSEGELAFGR